MQTLGFPPWRRPVRRGDKQCVCRPRGCVFPLRGNRLASASHGGLLATSDDAPLAALAGSLSPEGCTIVAVIESSPNKRAAYPSWVDQRLERLVERLRWRTRRGGRNGSPIN